ncbi:hypothetical protein [Streptomyces murinus]|uniref:hypothetical protein n=1 Tax=Streptomyces murinus TaxID=33900 RepID=UPI0038005B3A
MSFHGNSTSRPYTPVRQTVASTRHGQPLAGGHSQEIRDKVEKKLMAYRSVCASRDDLVVQADSTGFSEVQIAKLMGHSRTTIRGILKACGARGR